MKPVLLTFPGNRENMPTMPVAAVVLASFLREHKIPVEILDTRIEDYKSTDFNNYSLIGISAKSGEQTSFAVELCKFIRAKCNVPIVWGGPHPSFFPEQTCGSELADFVAIGEGEETLLELVMHIQGKKKLEGIKGLAYKKDSKVIVNEDREFLDMEKLGMKAYDLIKLKKYQDSVKYFKMETSRGCPYRCDFCYTHQFHKRKWRSKSVGKVIGEMKHIMKEYGVNKFGFCDDNFFVDKKRAMDIARKIIEERLNIEVYTSARANYCAHFSEDELELLSKSGFKYIAMGAESGSQDLLNMIHKDISREDIIMSAKNCIAHGITPVYSFVIGIPGEKPEDVNKTIDIYLELKKISPKVEIDGFFLFTPYPGTPIYYKAIEKGYKPFDTLEGWASWKFSDLSNVAWADAKTKKRLQVLAKLILFLFIKERLNSYGTTYKKEKLSKWRQRILWDVGSYILGLDANYRLKNKVFGFGYEWILFGKIALTQFKI